MIKRRHLAVALVLGFASGIFITITTIVFLDAGPNGAYFHTQQKSAEVDRALRSTEGKTPPTVADSTSPEKPWPPPYLRPRATHTRGHGVCVTHGYCTEESCDQAHCVPRALRDGHMGCFPKTFRSAGTTANLAPSQIPTLLAAPAGLLGVSGVQRYWECGQAYPGHSCEGPFYRKSKPGMYLTYDPYGAGLNNERLALEIAYSLAYLWQRTLVLPPTMTHDPRMGASLMEEYFNLDALREGLDVMTFEEFVAAGQPGHSLAGIGRYRDRDRNSRTPVGSVIEDHAYTFTKNGHPQGTYNLNWDVGEKMWCYPSCPEEGHPQHQRYLAHAHDFPFRIKGSIDFTKLPHQEIRSTGETVSPVEAKIIHIGDQILFGNYYANIFVEDPDLYDQLRWTVRACVRFRDEFHDKAAEVVKRLGGMGNYNAIHLRRDDWSELLDEPITYDPEGLGRRAKAMPKKETLYVAVKFKTRNVGMDGRHDPDHQREMWETKEMPSVASQTGSKLITSQSFFCDSHPNGCDEGKMSSTEDFVTPPALPTSCVDWTAVVEMIVLAQAANFMGTAWSTYTGNVQRMHGFYHQTAPQRIPASTRLYYVMNDPREFPDKVPTWADEEDIGKVGQGLAFRLVVVSQLKGCPVLPFESFLSFAANAR